MTERIQCLHPEGKQGAKIERAKYDAVRDVIIEVVRERGQVSFQDLLVEANRRLEGRFDGSISWYTVSVKLDLEARGIITRVPGVKPQVIRLAHGEEP